MNRRSVVLLKSLPVGLLLTLTVSCSDQPLPEDANAESEPGSNRQISLDSGRITGALSPYDTAIAVHKGIPFAAPPIGKLRWQSPQPVQAWTGVRRAEESGSPCWQPLVPETSLYSRGPMDVSEDCLHLNVWSSTRSSKDKRPVMVWYHGGANRTGHGSSLIFDGTSLAKKGVVVVTVNYRMGAFGFFAHPLLSAESEHGSSGNYALQDQIMALRWVRTNIEQFGGDPDRVLIFGQSAGATDVCLLMASPLANGLFHRAIGHSGAGCLDAGIRLDQAEQSGLAIATALGATGPDALTRLRSLSPEEFMATAGGLGTSLNTPIVDGWVIPDVPGKIFAAGNHNRVPLIAGDMSDEFRGLQPDIPELPMDAYAAQIAENYPGHGEAVLEAYRTISEVSTKEASSKMLTHSVFVRQSRNWASLVEASGDPSYLYYFTHPTAVFSLYIPDRPEFPDPNPPRSLGAYHSGDLAYHFNNTGIVGLGWTQADHALADSLSSYWVNFAKTGDPNGEGIPPWPVYRRLEDRVQTFGSTIENVPNPLHARLNLFDEVYQANP